MFVEPDDFLLPPFNLPNVDVDSAPSWQDFVDAQEEIALRELLGDTFYEGMVEGLDEILPEQRWIDLRDGVAYVDPQGKPRKWNGMKALLKPLIYSLWLRYSADNVAGTGGVVVAETENSETTSSGPRIVMGQNEYSKQAGWDSVNSNTLFQYLYTSGDLYVDVVEDWDSMVEYLASEFCHPGYENEFDL